METVLVSRTIKIGYICGEQGTPHQEHQTAVDMAPLTAGQFPRVMKTPPPPGILGSSIAMVDIVSLSAIQLLRMAKTAPPRRNTKKPSCGRHGISPSPTTPKCGRVGAAQQKHQAITTYGRNGIRSAETQDLPGYGTTQ